jgi:hypothetical protein
LSVPALYCGREEEIDENPIGEIRFGSAPEKGTGTLASSGIELPPIAPFLMQSLRVVRHSVQAALADLIDKSIAAGANLVSIDFLSYGVATRVAEPSGFHSKGALDVERSSSAT